MAPTWAGPGLLMFFVNKPLICSVTATKLGHPACCPPQDHSLNFFYKLDPGTPNGIFQDKQELGKLPHKSPLKQLSSIQNLNITTLQ